jgi:hypothetical protein
MLRFERDLLQLIEQHYEQVQETRQTLRLSPENVHSVVEVALQLAGQPALRPIQVDGLPHGKAFQLPPLSGSWATCTEGLAHPHTGNIRPIVFDHAFAKRRDDVVLAHLNHRLVQMALRLLRAEVWSPEGRRGLHRVTARRVPHHVLDTPAVIAHARLVVTGGDSHRLHEQIITAGGRIYQGRFRRLNVGQRKELLDAASVAEVSDQTKERLVKLWPSVKPAIERSLDVRVQERTAGIARLLRERQEKEMSDIEAILSALAKAIEMELEEPEYRQLELFTDNERSQLSRNTQALQARLDRIPAEIEAEKEAVRGRFADPQPRLFPVAVTFLVPERLA